MMIGRALLYGLVSLGLVACGGSDSSGGDGGTSASAWRFTDDNVDFGITDVVSPDAVLLDDGSVRLYTTELGHIGVYAAAPPASGDLAFAVLNAGVSTPIFASDPTLIQQSDGSWRMYYVDHSVPDGPEKILTATSPDGLSFTAEGDTGISNASGSRAWGVPDTVELSDGSIRIYWVDTVSGMSGEVIKSASSSDGVTFTEETGYRTTGGYVDPYIFQTAGGEWVGLFSTSPGLVLQAIHVGTSSDGLVWTVEPEPLITVSGGNALDPTAVDLGNGTYRVYYVATTGSDAGSGFYLKSGVLSRI